MPPSGKCQRSGQLRRENRCKIAKGVSPTKTRAGKMCTSVRTEWEANKRSNSTNCGGPVDEWNARAMTRRTTTATAIKVHSQNPARSHNGTYGFAALNSVLKLHSLCDAEKTVYLFLRSVIYRRKTNSRNHKTTCSRYCCSQPRDQLDCDLPGRSRSRETGSSSDCDNAIGTSPEHLCGNCPELSR